jgi:hypothetical protein
MIKLRQITTENAEIILTFDYDQGGQAYSVKVSYDDIRERLRQIKGFLGRPLTLQDAKLVIVKMVNEIRTNGIPLLERFDFNQFIGVDLEA